MEYKKYQHVEKLGREECEGVLDSDYVYCFAKIDGTNGCLFLGEDGRLKAGSRNRELSLDNDNAGFYADCLKHSEFKAYLDVHSNHILYGEWLVKHTIKTYEECAWRKFYVFDVYDNDKQCYLPYTEYKEELEKFHIGYIPVMAVLNHPTLEDIAQLAKQNHFLMSDKENIGEGIVCKSYGYRNKYGRETWGKLVAEEFFQSKEKLRTKNHECKSDFEAKIANEYITDAVIKKEYAKLVNEFPNAKQKEMIGRVLNAVYTVFIDEDLLTVVRKNKTCTINFRFMKKQSDLRVKEVLRNQLF